VTSLNSGALVGWIIASLALSLRIAPVFALAPPFSLAPVPTLFRVLFGVGLASMLVASHPASVAVSDLSIGALAGLVLQELAIGMIVVMVFQLMFAALYMAGRTIDIQAGFGLATLIDPTTRTQTPLVGTLFAFGAGEVFFAMNGHSELLRIFAASLDAIPLGAGRFPQQLAPLLGYISVIFISALGAAGGTILCLFLADLSIAALSRTTPQMNVLVLGFQAKTLILLLVLPTTLGLSGALFARMVRITLEALPRLL
jgi:flagellar biosynthetic protein FliR